MMEICRPPYDGKSPSDSMGNTPLKRSLSSYLGLLKRVWYASSTSGTVSLLMAPLLSQGCRDVLCSWPFSSTEWDHVFRCFSKPVHPWAPKFHVEPEKYYSRPLLKGISSCRGVNRNKCWSTICFDVFWSKGIWLHLWDLSPSTIRGCLPEGACPKQRSLKYGVRLLECYDKKIQKDSLTTCAGSMYHQAQVCLPAKGPNVEPWTAPPAQPVKLGAWGWG